MKKLTTISAIMLLSLIYTTNLFAQDSTKASTTNTTQQKNQARHGAGFVDTNGDGYNDNAPDHDGDGIPNGLDEDYDGPGKMGFVDEDGDGINDNAGYNRKGKGNRAKFNNSATSKTMGPGSGMQGTGSGNGQGSASKGNVEKGKRHGGN